MSVVTVLVALARITGSASGGMSLALNGTPDEKKRAYA
jgi:hypothetical protein